MTRINLTLPGDRLVSIDTGDTPDGIARFLANNYPDAQHAFVQNIPPYSLPSEEALPVPALNFTKHEPKAEGSHEEPLPLPRLF